MKRNKKRSWWQNPGTVATEAEARGNAIQTLPAKQLGSQEGLAVARVGHRRWSVRDILTCEVLATAATGGDAIRAANAHRLAQLTQVR